MLTSALRRLRAAGTAAAVAAAALVVPTVAATSAHADTTICGQYDSVAVSGGQYIVQNNEWGDTIQQCLDVTNDGFSITTGNHNVGTGGAPAAYPSIYAGCHYGNCSSSDGLPQQVSSFTNPTSSVSFNTASGSWDSSYDIWFDTQPNPSGQNDGEELMIWANHSGPPTPFGSKVGTVSLEGATWDVWYGRQGSSPAWNTVSYVREQTTNAITVNIKDFTDDSIARGYMNPAWYMTSVQFGFEPWQGGPGLGVNSFSYTPNGSGGGDTAPPSVPAGLAVTGTTDASASLSWNASTDNVGVAGYDVYRDGTRIGTTTTTGYTDSGLAASTAYSYTVAAYDAAGNTSAQSSAVGATTGASSGGGGGGGGKEIVGQGSGRCLDDQNGGTADGNPVQLWDCSGGPDQLWTQNGSAFVNTTSGKCLDVAGGATTDGTQVRLYTCNGTGAQNWQVNANGTITNPQSGKCLDADNQGTANGTLLQIWDCYGGGGTQSNQVWTLE